MLLTTLMLSVAVHAGFELEAGSVASPKADVVESVESAAIQVTQDVPSIVIESQVVQDGKEEQPAQDAKGVQETQAAQTDIEEKMEQEASALQEAQVAKDVQTAQEAKALQEAQAAQIVKEEQAAQEAKALQEAQAAQIVKEEQVAQQAKALQEAQAAQIVKEEQVAQQAKALEEAQAAQLAKEAQAAQEAKVLQEAQATQAAKEELVIKEAKVLQEMQATQIAKEEQKVRLEQVAQAAQIFPKKIITPMASFDLVSSKMQQEEQVVQEVRVLKPVEPVVQAAAPSRWDVRINDVTLRQALSRWSSDAGWQLAWEVKVDYPVQLEASFSGTFDVAVGHFINALRNSDYPLVACLYEGNRVVRVLHYGENKGCAQ